MKANDHNDMYRITFTDEKGTKTTMVRAESLKDAEQYASGTFKENLISVEKYLGIKADIASGRYSK